MKKTVILIFLLCLCTLAFSQDNYLMDRNYIPTNFLSQYQYQLKTGLIWDAHDKPSTALSEGYIVYQNVGTNFANYSISLYSDVQGEDLYINTGAYGTPGQNWKGWKKFLHSGNFSSYVLPLTGGIISGSLGVQATVPAGYKFAVNGSAIFTKVVVKNYSNWPDYVFNSSYKLPSLELVEKFIIKFKHLPNIASAMEIEKNGVDIGATQAALLRKIEELTLYVIDLKKEVTKLKQQKSNKL